MTGFGCPYQKMFFLLKIVKKLILGHFGCFCWLSFCRFGLFWVFWVLVGLRLGACLSRLAPARLRPGPGLAPAWLRIDPIGSAWLRFGSSSAQYIPRQHSHAPTPTVHEVNEKPPHYPWRRGTMPKGIRYRIEFDIIVIVLVLFRVLIAISIGIVMPSKILLLAIGGRQ